MFSAFPALASAASISGTVTEAAGAQAPLEGVRVCADQQNFQLERHCTGTDAAGGYSLAVAVGAYAVHFDDAVRNRNLVSRYYGGGPAPLGTLVEVASDSEARTGIDAALQPGSTIAGVVTEAVTHLPIAGIPVCAEVQTPTGPYGRCEQSGAGGVYVINGLAPGDYVVDFQKGELNYQRQQYPGTVTVLAAGETHGEIDAEMRPGFEISGRLTEAGTGAPAAGVNLDLLWVGSEESAGTTTDAAGNYLIRGLPEADFVLLFSRPIGPAGADVDCFAQQYYKGSSSREGATVLHGVPGTALTEIDAELTNVCPPPGPPPLQVTLAPAATGQVGAMPRVIHCHKGSHRKRVKGKVRCVRRHKHHKRHHHRRHRQPSI